MARINKELVALNLLTYPTNKEAAEKSGISITTLYRLKNDDEFQKVLQKVKNSIFQETMHKAQGYCLESLEVLREVAGDKNATDSSRVSAARTILELGVTLHEDENIIQRLAEMERRLLDG
ncbi:hypothetical protein [Gemmiger formicilis]